MKKILFGILTFLGIGLSFCNAGRFYSDTFSCYIGTPIAGYDVCDDDYLVFSNDYITSGVYVLSITATNGVSFSNYITFDDSIPKQPYYGFPGFILSFDCSKTTSGLGCKMINPYYYNNVSGNGLITYTISSYSDFFGSSSSSSDIDVYYNNGNSTETITCDGTQAIQINGLSTITSTNTFTPYYNISYTDEDNQKLIESYSKDILYLENGQFKKTYTGENDWILTYEGSSENTFTGYVPVFDFTGDTIINSGNVFNNFSDNALKVLLSNIPSYIQYITIFAILVFLFSFVRRFKRKS